MARAADTIGFMRTFATTVIALAVLAVSADASAFCRSTTCRSTGAKECKTDANTCPLDGAKLFWPTSCVSFSLNQLGTQELDPQETFAVIRKTFQAWTEVPCPGGGRASMTFEERGPVSCKKSEYNKDGHNLNVILFQDDDWTYRGIDGTLAKTSVTYNDETGEIYDADIEVNAANNTVTLPGAKKVEFDLQAILTHEVGHFIGIAHSSGGSAVMAPTYASGSIAQRTLTPDDVAAVCAIYPPKSGVACVSEPRGGFSESCGAVATKKGLCSVSSPPASGHDGSGSTASLALMGLGVLTVARLARRSHGRGKRS